MRAPAVLLALSATVVFACAKSTSTASSDGGLAPINGDADAAGDGPAAVDDGGSEAQAGACVVKRVTTTSDCNEDCGARLLLSGGAHYCTVECAATPDCAPYGGDLVCLEQIACVPRCTADDTCKAAGFLRCNTAAGGCDTQ